MQSRCCRWAKTDLSRGAVLVEFALALPFLVLLIAGMVDFGLLFNDTQSLRQGVREAVREATANPSQFESVSSVTCQNLSPVPTTGSGCFQEFIQKRTGLSASRLSVSWSPSGDTTAGATFQVCARYTTASVTGIAAPFLPSVVHADVSARMEQNVTDASGLPASPAAVC
jgi:Flp pilus assembly protein TadG